MPGMNVQPFEVNDFSGGITENILQGDPRRAAIMHNFIYNVDHKIEARSGYRSGFGLGAAVDGQIPSAQRVSNMFTAIDEQYLFLQSARSLFWYDPINGYTRVTGPGGNEAISGGDVWNQTTTAEFQHIVYMSSDGGNTDNFGVLPNKIFRNTSNAWVSMTTGLPRVYATPTFNSGSLLSSCISLANALRTAMIAHFSDATPGNVYNSTTINSSASSYRNPSVNSLHAFTDKYSLSYLQSTSFTIYDAETPPAIPTPAPAATDQASLFTLVGALNSAFSHHVADPSGAWSGDSGQGFYHYWMVFSCPANSPYNASAVASTTTIGANVPKGPNLQPSNPGTPSVAVTDIDNSNALLTCASMLNDLYQKYNWHRLGVYTHSPMNDPSVIDRNRCAVGKIGAIGNGLTNVTLANGLPTILPDYTDIFNYVNNLKFAYNFHVKSYPGTGLPGSSATIGFHKSVDIPTLGAFSNNAPYSAYQWFVTSNYCYLPDCTDLDSMYLLIYWLRVLYGGFHVNDANSINFIRTSMTTVGQSPVVSSLVRTDTTTSLTPNIYGHNGNNLFIPGTVSPTGIVFDGTALTGSPIMSFITASGLGAATFQRQLSGSQTTVIGQYSDSLYHASWSIVDNDVNTSSVAQESSASFLSSEVTATALDTSGWLTLATEFFQCFSSHLSGTGNNSAQSHVWNSTSISSEFQSSILNNLPHQFFVPEVSAASYAFFWSHQYTVEPSGIIYLTQGNPTFTNSLSLAVSYPVGYSIPSQSTDLYPAITASNTRGNTLSNLPTLANDLSTNYDTSNVLLNIYKTTNGGTTWFLVTQINNGTLTYTDTSSDTISTAGSLALNTKQPLYTTGGVVGYDQAPISKFLHILNGTAYYGAVVDTGQYFPQRIRQSIPFAPDSSPATFFLDLDDALTGLSSARANVIAFCKNSVHRVSGQFNILGQGAMSAEKISDGIGCFNAKSIVRTEVGVFYAGTDGFYYTDGFQIIKISLELDKTYKALTATAIQQQGIFGVYDKIHRRILWNMRVSPSEIDNNITYVFYLNYGVKPSGVFTTLGNAGDGQVRQWLVSSMAFWNGFNIRGDNRGYVFQAQDELKTDPKIDTTVSQALWNTVYIPYKYRSVALDLGGTTLRKWINKIHLVGKNTGNVAMQINIIKDLNPNGLGVQSMSSINYTDNCTWGNPTFIWNDPVTGPLMVWNPAGKMDLWRRVPNKVLRSDFVQVEMKPASIAVYASQDTANFPTGSTCVVDGTLKTATITSPAGFSLVWPLDVVDYQIFFATDGYINGYTITAVSGAVITFADPNSTATTVTCDWVMRGTKKEQRPSLTSYLLNFMYYGEANQSYPGKFVTSGPGNAGENPS